ITDARIGSLLTRLLDRSNLRGMVGRSCRARRRIGSEGDPTAEGEKEREEESSHRSNMGDRPMEGLFI
ncbi:hypothetical protein PMAYCL1PPCAC_22748, partial [Pristionchus mayeri]